MRKKRILSNIIVVNAFIGLINCGNHELATRAYPIVNTYPATNVNENGAILNGEILNLGESGVSDYGFVYTRYPGETTFENSNIISLGPKSSASKISSLANRDLEKGRIYYVKAYAVGRTNDMIVYGQEVSFVSLGGMACLLNDFQPKQGQIGDTVVFIGTGFSNINSDNLIIFGTTTTNPIKSRPDSLWCIVPPTTNPGQNLISLTVGLNSATISNKFTLNKLTINSFSPSLVSFGDIITLTGSNIPRQKALITISALGQADTVISVNSNQIKVKVSALAVIPSSIITVTAGVQSVSTNTEVSLVPPTISSFSPTQGKEYAVVQINGDYFSPIKENNIVSLGGVSLVVTQSSKTSLSIIYVPTGIAPGAYPFTVSVATQVTTSPNSFTVLQ